MMNALFFCPASFKRSIMKKSKALVFVVDDDRSLRKSLQRLLKSCGYNVETFETAQDFLKSEKRKCRGPCCIVLDIFMPGLSGLDLHQEFLKNNISLPVIFITGRGNIPMSVRAMKDGAVDFLPKPFEEKDLLEAISRAIEKDRKGKKKQREIDRIKVRINTLTAREREVLGWVITGMLNKQIAYELGTSEKTIKVHRGRILSKMKADSVAELVRLAQKAGISPARKTP